MIQQVALTDIMRCNSSSSNCTLNAAHARRSVSAVTHRLCSTPSVVLLQTLSAGDELLSLTNRANDVAISSRMLLRVSSPCIRVVKLARLMQFPADDISKLTSSPRECLLVARCRATASKPSASMAASSSSSSMLPLPSVSKRLNAD